MYRLAGKGAVSPELENFGKIVVNICVLSIVLTAPIGAIIITVTGPKLLSRTTKPPILEGKDVAKVLFMVKPYVNVLQSIFIPFPIMYKNKVLVSLSLVLQFCNNLLLLLHIMRTRRNL